MAAYPDIINDVPGVIPFTWGITQVILKSEFATGVEQRRLVWQAPRRTVSINYKALSITQANTLWQFYADRQGAFRAFSFFFPRNRSYVDEFIGTSDGSATSIYLPSKDASSYTLKQGGTIVSSGNYTFYTSTGDGVSDYLVLNSAIANGIKLTWSFTGRLKIKARFDENVTVSEEIKDISNSAVIDLVGLQHEITTP